MGKAHRALAGVETVISSAWNMFVGKKASAVPMLMV